MLNGIVHVHTVFPIPPFKATQATGIYICMNKIRTLNLLSAQICGDGIYMAGVRENEHVDVYICVYVCVRDCLNRYL